MLIIDIQAFTYILDQHRFKLALSSEMHELLLKWEQGIWTSSRAREIVPWNLMCTEEYDKYGVQNGWELSLLSGNFHRWRYHSVTLIIGYIYMVQFHFFPFDGNASPPTFLPLLDDLVLSYIGSVTWVMQHLSYLVWATLFINRYMSTIEPYTKFMTLFI
jgi:hypothetical protein